MNVTYKALALTAALLGSSLIHASTAGVALTNDTAHAEVNLSMGTFGIEGGATYDSDASASIGYVGLLVQDSEGDNGPFEAGVGFRAYVIGADVSDNDNEISSAIGLGGWYRFTIPQANRLSLFGSLYYSPEVLTFSNADHMYNYDFRFEYMVMQNARAFLRYSNTVVVYDDDSRNEIDKGFSIGATVEF